jgi:hypothetical protein
MRRSSSRCSALGRQPHGESGQPPHVFTTSLSQWSSSKLLAYVRISLILAGPQPRWGAHCHHSASVIGQEHRHYARPSAMSAACRARLNKSVAGCWAGVSRWSPGSKLLLSGPIERRISGTVPRSDRGAASAAHHRLRSIAAAEWEPTSSGPGGAVARGVARPGARRPRGSTSFSPRSTRRTRWPGCSATRPSRCRSGPSWLLLSGGKTSRPARLPGPVPAGPRRADLALLGGVRPPRRGGVQAPLR